MIARATNCKICRTCLITIIEDGRGEGMNIRFAWRKRRRELRKLIFLLGLGWEIKIQKHTWQCRYETFYEKRNFRNIWGFPPFRCVVPRGGGRWNISNLRNIFKCMNMCARDMSATISRIYKNSFAMTLTIFPRFL